LPIVKVNLK